MLLSSVVAVLNDKTKYANYAYVIDLALRSEESTWPTITIARTLGTNGGGVVERDKKKI